MGKFENKRAASPRLKLTVGFACLLLVLGITVGGTLAYHAMTSGGVSNMFSAGTVGCELKETVTNNEKTSITVTNSGNTPVYVRIRLVTYWQNAEGKPAGKTPAVLQPDVADGWQKIGDAYYYTKPVQGNGVVEFLKSPLEMFQQDGYMQVINVLAESIQSAPSNAVTEAWGRTVDTNGSIIG